MAFSEGKAIPFWGPIMPSHTEEDLVNGIIGYFSICWRIEKPFGDKKKSRRREGEGKLGLQVRWRSFSL